MGQANTNARRRRQMAMNNAHLSGPGVSRYGRIKSAEARIRREAWDRAKAAREGRSYGYGSK